MKKNVTDFVKNLGQQENLSPSQEIKPQTYRFNAPMPNL